MPKTPGDHALILFKAALNVIPGIGGPIASLVGDYVPLSTQRALEQTAGFLRDKLGDLERRIDADAVDKEDFSELYKTCVAIAARTNREEKLRAAANLMANLLLAPGDPAKCSYEELDHFAHCVETLSIGAITVLGGARQIPRQPSRGDPAIHFGELRRKFPQWEPAFVLSLASELAALNLLHIQEGAINTPDYEAYLMTVTPIGARFADRFIEGRM